MTSVVKNTDSCATRKRVLIVNAFFDDSHRPLHRRLKLPQAMGPAYLAGMFSRERCDIRLYSELRDGPLEDRRILAWPDMLVLTGLTNAFDRMLHLTAYARTLNPEVVVVAGGPAVRALPELAKQYFDYCCVGDVEQLADVVAEVWGRGYAAGMSTPRFDLAYWMGRIGYVESSRNCNFHCDFCSLTGEGRRYWNYDLASIRRQIQALGRRKFLQLIDNNFYGNDRALFLARLELIQEMREEGWFRAWGALVTNDFFYRDENLRLAREAGCILLFSGVESFDSDWLRNVGKLQNTRVPQVELIRKCLDAGIVFSYGLISDLSTRLGDDLRRELDFIMATPEITLPAFVTNAIPLVGTPYFRERLARGEFLPNTRLRDLDGTTIAVRPADELGRAVQFLRDVQCFRGYRAQVFRHSVALAKRYRKVFDKDQMGLALANALLLCAAPEVTAPNFSTWLARGRTRRTFVSSTEPLDKVYTPAFRVESRYAPYFQPTMVTDAGGNPTGNFEQFAEKAAPQLPVLSS